MLHSLSLHLCAFVYIYLYVLPYVIFPMYEIVYLSFTLSSKRGVLRLDVFLYSSFKNYYVFGITTCKL